MPRVWFSLHCKSETSDVHDPKSKTHLSVISARRPGRRSGCSFSRSIANLKDVVINGGSSRRHFDKPPTCSPRSIGSSEFLNPITHEVILSNSTCELKISGIDAAAGGGPTFVGALWPGTPSSFRNSASSTPRKSSPSLISDSEGGFVTSKRFSFEVDSNGYYPSATCCKCGEKLSKWDDAESHHLSKHAVTELVEGDSSRKIVEIICRTSWMKPEMNKKEYYCSRMDKVLKVHNTHKTLARFEEYRESVKKRESKLQKKHPRCLADGNELLRFYATTLSCSLGFNTNTTLCVSENCCVCRIIRNGFSVKEEVKNGNGIGIFTAATSGRALESVEDDGGGGGGENEGSEKMKKEKKVLIVCRVIAGRVHRPLENVKDMVGLQNGFDSLAGKLGVYSNIEELYLLDPSSLLPCFVVICKP